MRRSPARKHRIRRLRRKHAPVGWGPQGTDAVTGWEHPLRLMVRTEAGLVSREWRDGGRDRPKEW